MTTPAQQAKRAGLDSLEQVARATGQSPQTLSNWAKNKPELFRVVLQGCLVANLDREDKQVVHAALAHYAAQSRLYASSLQKDCTTRSDGLRVDWTDLERALATAERVERVAGELRL